LERGNQLEKKIVKKTRDGYVHDSATIKLFLGLYYILVKWLFLKNFFLSDGFWKEIHCLEVTLIVVDVIAITYVFH
jgi:hypothetical protein